MSTHTPSLYNNKNPFPALHTVNRSLCGADSDKDTRHHEISLAGSGITYEPGDALALKSTNDPGLVELTIQALGANGDEPVTIKEATKTLREWLTTERQIHFVEKKFLTKLAEKGAEKIAELLKPENAAALTEYTSAKDNNRDYVDVLGEFPEIKFTPTEFVETLRVLAIRLYSIASSLQAHPEEVHLTVATVRWNSRGRERLGVCSTFLAERWEGDTKSGLFIQGQKHFRLPEDPNTPVIMVGPGTGLAPFRAFLEHRDVTKAPGKNWLFFGERKPSEFFYEEQIRGWQQSGVLTRLNLAWSRLDPNKKDYVQDHMRAEGAEIWKWLSEGAYFYVCGDKSRMAADVHKALIEIAQVHGGLSEEAAKEFIEADLMKKEPKRYRRDVY